MPLGKPPGFKKVISLKSVKFNQENGKANSSSMLPRPPIPNKKAASALSHDDQITSEALLKMADASIANIDNELREGSV